MNPFLFIVIALALVVALFWLIRLVLAPKRPFTDFLVGDSGRYSLSRLQATVWAIAIIGYQLSVMLTLWYHQRFDAYSLVFAEETIWLLGLSYGSYITVKGISSNPNLGGGQRAFVLKSQRTFADLISSDEGLDLSRFQMLIWTFIAVFVFFNSVDTYLANLMKACATGADLKVFFPTFDFQDEARILPTIDMSFLVLMGLSQGAYIGRKLVPSHKVAEFRQEYYDALEVELKSIDIGIRFQEAEYEMIQQSETVSMDKKVQAAREFEIVKKKREKLQRELDDLKKMKESK
ncbi:MAG: hypothetical protein AB7K37_06600 [Cyclobacteriaceae bacterium]